MCSITRCGRNSQQATSLQNDPTKTLQKPWLSLLNHSCLCYRIRRFQDNLLCTIHIHILKLQCKRTDTKLTDVYMYRLGYPPESRLLGLDICSSRAASKPSPISVHFFYASKDSKCIKVYWSPCLFLLDGDDQGPRGEERSQTEQREHREQWTVSGAG